MFLVTEQTLLIRNKCKPLGLALFNSYPRAKRIISYVCSHGSHSTHTDRAITSHLEHKNRGYCSNCL